MQEGHRGHVLRIPSGTLRALMTRGVYFLQIHTNYSLCGTLKLYSIKYKNITYNLKFWPCSEDLIYIIIIIYRKYNWTVQKWLSKVGLHWGIWTHDSRISKPGLLWPWMYLYLYQCLKWKHTILILLYPASFVWFYNISQIYINPHHLAFTHLILNKTKTQF